MAVTDWQVGDLAVCVDDARRPITILGAELPKAGLHYRVAGVNGQYLTIIGEFKRGITAGKGFLSDRFRKIRPDEHEACEPEFVTLLKRKRATRVAPRHEVGSARQGEHAVPKGCAR